MDARNAANELFLSFLAGLIVCATFRKGREMLAEFWPQAMMSVFFILLILLAGTAVLTIIQLACDAFGWNVHLITPGPPDAD